ncbi:hypothetical protein [Agromyces silvae]|uniref:hypothetical protein n=1 Tax=Agromyces silvae TaxID=3388266 RepID=UPI00280AE202|nr:hypothetical protein [Agromyces protaetiae]
MRSEPPTGDELNRMLVSMKQQVLEQAAKEPAPAARGRSIHRGLALGLGVTLFLGVGATAAYAITVAASQDPVAAPPSQTFTPPASPTPEPTPSATPAPPEFEVEPGQPASRYGLDCDTLVDPALINALFPVSVAPADPIVTASGVGISIPRRTSIMSIGGTVCEWSNGVASNDQYGVSPEHVGVTISVTPRPAVGWSPRTDGMLDLDRWSPDCGVDTGSCFASAGVNDAWVTIETVGATTAAMDLARWHLLRDSVIDTVAAAGPAAPPSFVERSEASHVGVCESLLPLESVRSTTARPDVLPGSPSGGGWSDWAEAASIAGNLWCAWSGEEDMNSAATLSWIRDGRWAFTRMLEAQVGMPVEIAGLPSAEPAIARCYEFGDGSICAVDLMIGDDWFNVSARTEATAVALAEDILQRSAE